MDRYAFVLDRLRARNFRRLRRFQPRGSARFTTWLVLVSRRLCLDHRRLADLMGERGDVAELTDDAVSGP